MARRPQAGDLWDVAAEVAEEVIGAFSAAHPHIRMNMTEWQNLREMIEREVMGHFGEASSGMSARDLLVDG